MSNKEQAERERVERRRKRKQARERRRAQAQRDAAYGGRRMLRLADVEVRVGKKHAALYADMARGTFPKPIPLGKKAVGWLEHEVDAWLQARITERDSGSVPTKTFPAKPRKPSRRHAHETAS